MTVKVRVKNTGAVAGKEIVQLYLRAASSQYTRPVRELKAFAKVALEAGETKEVVLTLSDRDFMVYDPQRGDWRLEGGSYFVEVESSSVQIALSTGVNVWEDARSARGIFTAFTALGQYLKDPLGRELVLGAVKGSGAEKWIEVEEEMFTSMPLVKIFGFMNVPEETLASIVERVNKPELA